MGALATDCAPERQAAHSLIRSALLKVGDGAKIPKLFFENLVNGIDSRDKFR
jgi:hypothetical protein